MRRFFACLAPLLLAGCSCGGLPVVTLRSPLQLDQEPHTVAGPRMMAVPMTYAPTYAPTGVSSCGPAGWPAGYAYGAPAAAPAAAPCR